MLPLQNTRFNNTQQQFHDDEDYESQAASAVGEAEEEGTRAGGSGTRAQRQVQREKDLAIASVKENAELMHKYAKICKQQQMEEQAEANQHY